MRPRFLLAALLLIGSIAFSQSPAGNDDLKLPYAPVVDLGSMDRSVDPCTDFYKYSCGGWQKANPIPADQVYWGNFGKLADETRDLLRKLLEREATRGTARNADEQKIGDYYAACMDESRVEQLGAAPLQGDLERIAHIRNRKQLADMLAYLHGIGANAAFNFDSVQDARDATQFIAQLDQDGLGLPDRDFYFEKDEKSVELRAKYVAHVARMLELSGTDAKTAHQQSDEIMQLETALAQVSQTRVERRDPYKIYHKMTVRELETLAPGFPWKRYFEQAGLAGVQSLNVVAPDFFKGFAAQLDAVPLEQWKAYLRWHLVSNQAPYLSKKFVDANFDFYSKTLFGQQEIRPRWKRCVSQVDNVLGEALGKKYVEVAFPPESKQRTRVMVDEIETEMGKDIDGLPWMTDATKKEALKKLHTMVNKIGYPDHWRDYSAYEVKRDDLVGNASRGSGFEFHRRLGRIGKPVDKGEWGMTPPTVNAEYNVYRNDINFPAGILQPPFFDPKGDDAGNYGDIGSTVGHELTHGFDDEGRQYDEHGNLRNWWAPQDEKEFKTRAQCVKDQYAQYTIVDDLKIKSDLTAGEDIADLGGTILTWMAWKTHTKDMKLEPIDGFTPEQRFFIGYAQQWCTNVRDEFLRVTARTDEHSPDKYRNNGVVVNMPEFGQAFSCKKDSPMVKPAKDVCRIW